MASEEPQQMVPASQERLINIVPGRPAWPVRAEEEFGIGRAEWRTLVQAIFPSAKTTEGVYLALSYCRARSLDIFKRPVHVVPVWNSALGKDVEGVWAGIGELRTTAARTHNYAGIDDVEFGADIAETFRGEKKKQGSAPEAVEKAVTYPAWARATVYRHVGGVRCAFVARVFWKETYAKASRWSEVPNEMWSKRPYGQLAKCAEAAALRAAFPEEIGETYAAEEMEGKALLGPQREEREVRERGTEALVDRILAPQRAAEEEPQAEAPDDVPSVQEEAPEAPEPAWMGPAELDKMVKAAKKLGITGAALEQLVEDVTGLDPSALDQMGWAVTVEQGEEILRRAKGASDGTA